MKQSNLVFYIQLSLGLIVYAIEAFQKHAGLETNEAINTTLSQVKKAQATAEENWADEIHRRQAAANAADRGRSIGGDL